MKKIKRLPIVLTLLFTIPALQQLALGTTSFPRPASQPDRTQWFQDAKFGLFIHWGVFSMIGRFEEARQLFQIPFTEYQGYVENFNPENFDPDLWVDLAQEAGVKYVIITSKTADGFCLFDSQYTEYDVMQSKYGKDALGQIVSACRRKGMPVGFSYALNDWSHPDYLPRPSWELDRPAKDADFGRYRDYVKNQLRELAVKYEPDILWLDGEDEHTAEEWEAPQIEEMLRQIRPEVLINDRLFGREPGSGDFATPENSIPVSGLHPPDGGARLWEIRRTFDSNGGSLRLIRQLIEVASHGGNLLLDIGAASDGAIPAEAAAGLRKAGEWLRTNGESIYGTSAGVFERLPFFGRTTVKGEVLYVHIMGWPEEKKIRLPGMKSYLRGVSLLDGRKLNYRRSGKDIVISLPERPPNLEATVLAIELQGPPQAEPYEIRAMEDDRIELPVFLSDIQSRTGQGPYLDHFYRTTLLTNWQNVDDYPQWEFVVERDGAYEVQASYASEGRGGIAFIVEIDEEQIPGVGRNSPSPYLPKAFPLGTIQLKGGQHTLRFKITSVADNNALLLEKVILVPVGRRLLN